MIFTLLSNELRMEKKLAIVLLLIISTMIVIVIYFKLTDTSSSFQTTVTQLPVKPSYPPIFIKKMVWGLTGDKQVIVISNSGKKDFKPVKSKEYVYEGLFDIFYKLQNDTLFIYTPVSCPEPQELKARYSII